MIEPEMIPGWFEETDFEFVIDICKEITRGTVVEVGVYLGRSTFGMAPVNRENGNRHICVDNFVGGSSPAPFEQESECILECRFVSNMRTLGLLDFIDLRVESSVNAARAFKSREVDFCFIDADHSYKSVSADIRAWWPKIKEGGVLGGHDYYVEGPSYQQTGVQKAVDEWASRVRRDLFLSEPISVEESVSVYAPYFRCWGIRR